MGLRLVQILASFLAVVVVLTNASPRVRRATDADKNICPAAGSPARTFMYSDPDDCTRFFTCSHGVNYPQQCPNNLRFSNFYLTCASPGSPQDTCGNDTPGVTSSALRPTPAGPAPVNPYADKNICPPAGSPASTFMYSDPDDCTRFFTCSHGVNYPQQCPSNLRFSTTFRTCAHPGSPEDTCSTTGR